MSTHHPLAAVAAAIDAAPDDKQTVAAVAEVRVR